MTQAVRHRGPDDEGRWLDPAAGLALGHRRLAIMDVSPEGHQPMVSRDERFVIVFNGEIYNFRELREELSASGVRFRGHSDTEVLIEGMARWGVEAAIKRAAGMFALAAWDRERRVLHLARDRFGEKPLYFGWFGRTLLFGSELKALCRHPAWRSTIDRGALTLYLRFGYVPTPYSIYAGVQKLWPAHLVTVESDGSVMARPYWALAEVVARGLEKPLAGSDRTLVDELESRLRATIREEMVADRPLGALLSGGIDSTTVTALMQAESARPVRTFTIGFEESAYNEAAYAASVARHLGTDHTELCVTPAEAQAIIPRLPMIYDEPFGDCSQIPTLLVAELAHRHVVVALSGDGGDELFGGYNRYFLGPRIWSLLAPWPRILRRAAADSIRVVPPAAWGAAFGMACRMLPRRLRTVQAGDRMHKLAAVLDAGSDAEMYRLLCSHWPDPAAMVSGGFEPPTLLGTAGQAVPGAGFLERMMFEDARTYLPDDILVKVDRACMAVSLECRAPLLDHRVATLAWQLPRDAKVRAGKGKWALRQVAYRFVPRELLERPKQGFGVPIDSWLRGALREWAGDLLNEECLRRRGFLHAEPVAQKWREHLDGRRNWQYLLWGVLMFQAWLDAEQHAGSDASMPAVVA
jgi:asparagine synthase (glutamine-hydrolysing)